MAITNFQCLECTKSEVCKNYDILKKFDDDVKRPIGVNITIDKCENYDKVEE